MRVLQCKHFNIENVATHSRLRVLPEAMLILQPHGVKKTCRKAREAMRKKAVVISIAASGLSESNLLFLIVCFAATQSDAPAVSAGIISSVLELSESEIIINNPTLINKVVPK